VQEAQQARERESELDVALREERFGRRNTDEWLKPALRSGGGGFDAAAARARREELALKAEVEDDWAATLAEAKREAQEITRERQGRMQQLNARMSKLTDTPLP
jgi:hypothetical protein